VSKVTAPLRLRIGHDIGALEPARQAVLDHLGAQAPSARAVYAIELVLEEVLSNQIKYAFSDAAGRSTGAEPLIELTVWTEPGAVLLQFEDNGAAFDPLQAAAPVAPTSIDVAPVGGLGVVLVRKFASRASYQRREGRNCLTIGVALA
jgi:anti-sigma regulatory factor (Ser/Thr protein kinase)